MVTQDLLLGIDVGTYNLKTALWRGDGTLVTTCRREYGVQHPHPLWAEQDPATWWDALRATVRDVVGTTAVDPSRIRGIGISAFVPPLVPLDAQGDVLRPAILSFDQRSVEQAARLSREVGREVFAIAGNRLAPGAFSATSMVWIKEQEPQVFAATRTFVHATGYLVYRLTGRLTMDFSNASMTLLFDPAKRRWSEDLCDLIGVPRAKLPAAVGAWDVVGAVTADAGEALGLPGGIPVVAGGNDSTCSMLGAGVVEPGMVLESIGTSIVLAYVTDRPVCDARLMQRCHVVPDRWVTVAGMSTPGAAYRWFRDELGAAERAAAQRQTDPYLLMDAAAARSPPGARGLLFLPYLSGERSPIWNPKARGVLFGLTLRHTRGDVLRSILEGGAYAVRDNLDVFAERGLPVQAIRITGGGARSSLWRQIMADVLGVPLQTLATVETATLGAAILAGCGAGVYRSPQAAAQRLVRVEAGEAPRPHLHARYEASFALFKQVYDRLLDCYELAHQLEPADVEDLNAISP